MLKPTRVDELCEIVSAGKALDVRGRGTKRGLGAPVEATPLDLSRFSGIEAYEPDELLLTAGAATPVGEVVALTQQRGQALAFEPPDYAKLLGGAHGGSIGSLLACNHSGPRRVKAGAARDHILEVKGVTGRGEAMTGGARVVKNVTGYDIPKLMANSWGTLAALTSLTFKVLPAPETEETVAIDGLDDAAAVRAMSLAMQSACEVSGAAHLPGERRTLLRLEGIAASVAYRREKLLAMLDGERAVLAEAQSRAAWRSVRDVLPLADGLARAVWKISVPPMDGARVATEIGRALDARWFYDWAGGLIWLDCPQDGDAGAGAVRGAIREGHAMLFRAGEAARARVPVFHPQAPALAALARRVKEAFDPLNILNPGRMG